MKERITFISILVNILLTVGKFLAFYLSSSTSVLAESIHSLIDIVSSFIGFLGVKVSQKPEDEKHPFGHYKFEVLASLAITTILFLTGVEIIFEAGKKIFHPAILNISFFPLALMFVSALVNGVMAKIKIDYGKKENSLALLSDGYHSRVDVLTSLAVFFALLLSSFWLLIDSLLALLIGFYIIRKSWFLAKEAIDCLTDASAGEEVENKIKKIVKEKGIILNSLKTQKKGAIITANLEIILPSNLKVEKAEVIIEQLKKTLIETIKNLTYINIEIKSHQLKSCYYKPGLGGGFGWQIGKKLEDFCYCPNCGYKTFHQKGIPCSSLICPQCQNHLKRGYN